MISKYDCYENLHKVNSRFEKEFSVKLKKFLIKGWNIPGNEVLAFEKDCAFFVEQNIMLENATSLIMPKSFANSEEEVRIMSDTINKFFES